MSEERRTISVYDPRLQVPTETLGDGELEYGIYCLPRVGVDMALRITRYLTREVTYKDEQITETLFYGPTAAQLERAVDITGQLESGLMSECDLSGIISELETMNTTLALMQACTCEATELAGQQPPSSLTAYGNEIAPDIAESITIGGRPVPTPDFDKCNLANSIWGFQFQWLTENVLPFLSSAIDVTALAIAATSGFAVLSGGLGLPVAGATALFGILVNMVADTVVENLINWMIANSQEVVCHLYNGMVQGSYTAAALACQQHIEESGLPLGDRMMLKLTLTSEFYMQSIDQQIALGAINPADYLLYSCGSCDQYEYTYFFDGEDCPNGNLTGSSCDGDFPIVNVGNSAETTTPLVVFAPGTTSYDVSILASGNGTLGGLIDVLMVRGDNDVTVGTDQISVDPSATPELFELSFASYPLTGVYFKFQPSGASVAKMYWVGVNLT